MFILDAPVSALAAAPACRRARALGERYPGAAAGAEEAHSGLRHWCVWSKLVIVGTWALVSVLIVMVFAVAELKTRRSGPWTSTEGPNHACMMVAVRVADFGCGGAAPPPPGGGGAAPCTARAAGNLGGLTGLEASFMRKPGPQFRNPTPQTELTIACRFVFGVSEA